MLKYRENEGRNWLDNLKLGYGGTKGEMERLIADANRVKVANGEMADLSIDSFADVTEAIHIIQSEMGITGTTAKEAGTTIEGSVNSMKSAWSNLVTGLADNNANIEDLVRNLMTTIVGDGSDSNLGLLGNVMPAVERISKGIMEAMPQTKILQAGIQVVVSLVQGIAQQLPTLIPEMINALLTMVDTLLDNIDLIIDAGIQLIMGLADGLIEALPELIDKMPVIIDKLVTALVNNLPKLVEAGITLTVKLAEGIIKALPQLVSKIPQIISSLLNGIREGFGKMINIGGQLLGKVKDGIVGGIGSLLDVGKNIVKGLWNGINNAKDWVLDKIKGFGKAILNGIKGIFGIHSPSTVFRDQVGKNLALGIGEGFEDEMKQVTADMQNSIPSSFDTDLNVGSNVDTGTNNYYSMVEAFKEALSEMKIELDGETAARFVETTVANAVFN